MYKHLMLLFMLIATVAWAACPPPPPPPSQALAVNAGGEEYTAGDGAVYLADRWFMGGTVNTTTANIADTSDDALYRSERYGNFTYSLPLQNGTYTVLLQFAELYWNQRNRRIFDVLIEGQQVISNLDLYQQVGKNRAYDRTFTAQVSDSVLTIQFRTDRDNATVAAIRVTPQ